MVQKFVTDGVGYFGEIVPLNLIEGLLEEMIALSGHQANGSETLDSLFQLAEFSLLEFLRKNSKEDYLALMRALKSSLWIKQISVCPSIVTKARELLGSEHISQRGNPVLHITGDEFQLSENSLASPWHQDWPALRTSKKTIVVWLPLGGAEKEGALCFKVGSHKRGILQTRDIGSVYEIEPNELTDLETLQKGVNAGDAVFFDSLTAHSSKSTKSLRMALSFRFEDLSCREWEKRQFSSSHFDGIDKRELTNAEKEIFR